MLLTSRTGFVAYFKDRFVVSWLAEGKDILVQYIGKEEEETILFEVGSYFILFSYHCYRLFVVFLFCFFFLFFTAALFLS